MVHADRPDDLTAREREVLDLVRLGFTNEEIAARLGITEAGAKYHVSQILSKLGVATREEAAAVALAPRRRWGAALPLAAKVAGVAVVLAAVAGVGLLAWGLLRGSGNQEVSFVDSPSPTAVEVFKVTGASMFPALSDGTEVAVFPYAGAMPRRSDIVVFTVPIAPDRSFVKRVIGLPGDIVEFTSEGRVAVNQAVLDEPYVAGLTNCVLCEGPIQIPATGSKEARARCGSDACYLVLGDNRQNSSDSRQGWLVPLENIHGWVEVPSPSPTP